MGTLLRLSRMTISWLFRPLNDWFDTMEADVAFLVEEWKKANP